MKLILTTILTFIFMGSSHATTSGEHEGHQHSKHGFILVGKEQKYLYHLAKYNSPHQYMAIFQVDLYDESNQPFEPQSENAKVLSALSVDQFLLPQLADGTVDQFSVDIFDGYLRSDEKIKIHENIKVIVNSVSFFREIYPESYTPENLTYVLFGNPNDYYLTHSIGGSPNYEQILAIDIESETNLLSGKEVIINGRADNSPLLESSHASGEIDIYYSYKFNFFVKKEYILERGILKSSEVGSK